MTSQEKSDFPRWCRELRIAADLRQREVAERIGVKGNTYGNVESNNHKTISRERAGQVADVFKLGESTSPTREAFLAAWEALPQSDYSKRQEKSWSDRRAFRSKARNHDRVVAALIDLTALLLGTAPDPEKVCWCAPEIDQFGAVAERGESCELCTALKVLGIESGFTNCEEVVSKLAAIQESAKP